VTCGVAQTFAPVTNVTLNWRVMYDALQPMPMYDDGLHGDGAAGDGVYGAIITNHVGANWTYAAGQMVRWYVTAVDSLSHTSRWPLFTDPNGSAEYDGTVVNPTTSPVPSPLSICSLPHRFCNPDRSPVRRAPIRRGRARLAVLRRGILRQHQHEPAGQYHRRLQQEIPPPQFQQGTRFPLLRFRRADYKTSFEADYPDPSYMRQGMSFWLDDLVGVPPPFCYPVRLQLNGAFYELATHSDVQETEMLERIGYNPTGAYYANVGTAQPGGYSTGGFEKKTRPPLTDYTDYNDLINALAPYLSTGPEVDQPVRPARCPGSSSATWLRPGSAIKTTMCGRAWPSTTTTMATISGASAL